jgi:hypothetical protein
VIVIRPASGADLPALADLRRESTFELHPPREDEGFGERFAAWYEQEAPRRLTWLADDRGFARVVLKPQPAIDPFTGGLASGRPTPCCRGSVPEDSRSNWPPRAY